MDVLVKESLERLNEAINSINWEFLEEGKRENALESHKANKLRYGIRKAIRSVDVLKAVLKSLPFQ